MQLIYLIRKYAVVIVIGLSVLIFGLIFIFQQPVEQEEIIEIVNQQVENVTEEINIIKVNIKGAVVNPGVYELDSNSRVEDAINISGGLTENADTSIINLSRKLNDESVIIIYTKEEVKKIKSGNVVIQYIEKECNCPEYENSACIDPDTLINDNSNEDDSNNKISLNKATLKELQTLSGIGESKAKAIIEYREKNGLFKSIEEIKKVKGIGDAVFNKIKENITI